MKRISNNLVVVGIAAVINAPAIVVARFLNKPSSDLAKRAVLVGLLALVLSGCDAAGQGATTAPSVTPVAATQIAAVTPRATPDHFRLSPKTAQESSIFMFTASVGVNVNQWFPYAFGLDFHAFTIESVSPEPDGDVTVVLATNGGPIMKVDQNDSVTNYGGQVQELYGYESDPAAAANTSYTMRILDRCSLLNNHGQDLAAGGVSAVSAAHQYLKVGDSTVDFRALLNGDNASNVSSFAQLEASVGKHPSGISFVTSTLVLTDR